MCIRDRCAVVTSFLFPSTLILAQQAEQAAPGGIADVLQNLLNSAVSNPVSAIAEANYIGVLLWAVIFGLAMREAGEGTKACLLYTSEEKDQQRGQGLQGIDEQGAQDADDRGLGQEGAQSGAQEEPHDDPLDQADLVPLA